MNTARKGNGKELRSAELFATEGYVVGSRRHIAGPGDLLVVRARPRLRYTDALLVEVKCTAAGPFDHFGPADRLAMAEYCEEHWLTPALAWWAPKAKAHKLIFFEDWPRSQNGT